MMSGRKVAAPAMVAAVGLILALLAAGPAVSGSEGRAQETGAAAYEDSLRVDSLRVRITPDRLEELRRRAAEEGGARQWHDLGAALLLSGDWEGAIEPLERVIAADAPPAMEAAASYNLGVARAVGSRPPDSPLAQAAPADARRAGLLRARDAFREVLREQPGSADARWNLEVVDRWLAQLGGGGGNGGGEGGGDASETGQRREMTPEEVQQLLEAAASEERRVQEERFERSRARDPVAERNW